MDKPRSVRRDDLFLEPEMSIDEEPRRLAFRLVSQLLEGLRDQAGQLTALPDGLESWQDEFYCYLELKVDSPAECEVDVSVDDGRAFIRIRR